MTSANTLLACNPHDSQGTKHYIVFSYFPHFKEDKGKPFINEALWFKFYTKTPLTLTIIRPHSGFKNILMLQCCLCHHSRSKREVTASLLSDPGQGEDGRDSKNFSWMLRQGQQAKQKNLNQMKTNKKPWETYENTLQPMVLLSSLYWLAQSWATAAPRRFP